jgi:ribosomal protein S18 acetylase RimI-like enzyme
VIRIAPLREGHRSAVAGIVRDTGLFRDEEVDVALELFDSAHPAARSKGTHQTDTSPVSSDYFFLGAFTPEDELAGFACYGPTPSTDRTYDLYWIVIDPKRQRTGSGTILLNEVERRLEGLNARLVVVETSSRSDYGAARGFYVRNGYREGARTRGFYAPADDRITYIKRLQSRGSARRERAAHGVMSQ